MIPNCEICGNGTIYELKFGKYKTVCSKCLARLNPLVMQIAKMRQSQLLFNLTLGIAEHMTMEQLKTCGWFLRQRVIYEDGKINPLYQEIYVLEFHEPKKCDKLITDHRDFKGHILNYDVYTMCNKCRSQKERAITLNG